MRRVAVLDRNALIPPIPPVLFTGLVLTSPPPADDPLKTCDCSGRYLPERQRQPPLERIPCGPAPRLIHLAEKGLALGACAKVVSRMQRLAHEYFPSPLSRRRVKHTASSLLEE